MLSERLSPLQLKEQGTNDRIKNQLILPDPIRDIGDGTRCRSSGRRGGASAFNEAKEIVSDEDGTKLLALCAIVFETKLDGGLGSDIDRDEGWGLDLLV